MLAKLCVVGLVACGCAVGQAPGGVKTDAAAFDVVSIRPSGKDMGGSFGLTPSGFSSKAQPIYAAVMLAYFPMTRMFGYSGTPISGGATWLRKDDYDIEAKFDAATAQAWKSETMDQRWAMVRPMLQAMLAERCKLVAHMTMVDTPVYVLVVARHGPKLQETPPDEAAPEHSVQISDEARMIPVQRGATKPQFVFFRTSMADLARELSMFSGRQVVDHTGLAGKYDFAVPKIEPIALPAEQAGAAADPDDSPKWDVTEAGLELKQAKAPQGMLVIDSIEKPSEN